MGTRSPAGAEGPLAVHNDPVRAAPVESGYASGTVVAHLGLLCEGARRSG